MVGASEASLVDPVLTVVAPAFNQEDTIVRNIGLIADRLETIGVDYELILVSDGSSDDTFAEAASVSGDRVRVLGYDRNMGKGYAIRTGSRAARGRWVAWVDSDLDLDPAGIGEFLRRAQEHDLDVVVGSKRHPESTVDYPAKRRIFSWGFQQMVRLLFRLDVRDTQVGMKLFRRDVLREVLPVVLVKRYAFDVEVLAVANNFGFDRIVEAPIALDYQFSGSGMNWRAISHALWDTAAVFYRLRITRFYQHRRALWHRIESHGMTPVPSLSVITRDERTTVHDVLAALDGPAQGDVVAMVSSDAQPTSGWHDAALDLFRDPEVGAVVGPIVPRLTGQRRADAAGVLSESRIGVGGARVRHHVGQLRAVDDFPANNIFVRRDVLESALERTGSLGDELVRDISGRQGRTVLCSPDVIVTERPVPLWRPRLRQLFRVGRERGALRRGNDAFHARHLLPVALVVLLLAGMPAAILGEPWLAAWTAVVGAYAATIIAFGLLILLMHRRPGLAITCACGAVASHVTFGAAAIWGTIFGRKRATPS